MPCGRPSSNVRKCLVVPVPLHKKRRSERGKLQPLPDIHLVQFSTCDLQLCGSERHEKGRWGRAWAKRLPVTQSVHGWGAVRYSRWWPPEILHALSPPTWCDDGSQARCLPQDGDGHGRLEVGHRGSVHGRAGSGWCCLDGVPLTWLEEALSLSLLYLHSMVM
jgi:hypothetical protein